MATSCPNALLPNSSPCSPSYGGSQGEKTFLFLPSSKLKDIKGFINVLPHAKKVLEKKILSLSFCSLGLILLILFTRINTINIA